jgi:hypothetical protein
LRFYTGSENPGYDAALICLNGHRINNRFHEYPVHNVGFCPDCGAATTHTCRSCGAEIRGHYRSGAVVIGRPDPIPAFCHACGTPYPWTAAALDAAREYALEIEGLNADERRQLAESLDDLVRDTPRTTLAASRFKRLTAKAGGAAGQVMTQLAVSVLTEAAKKAVGL